MRRIMLATSAGAVLLAAVACGSPDRGSESVEEGSDAGALMGCGATDLGDGRADVPAEARGAEYYPGGLSSSKGTLRLLCGDGVSTGAVFLQQTQGVTDWVETATCVVRTVERGQPSPQSGATAYRYTFAGGASTVTISDDGSGTVATAGVDDRSATSWDTCAAT